VPIEHSIAGSAFKSNHPVKVLDVSQEPLYFPEADKLTNFPANSVLAVPLTFQERKIGVIEVVNKKQGQFDETDIEVLVVLAAQATITIEIARLYRQMQAEISERIKAEEELRRHQEHLEELVQERTAELQRLAITDPLTGLFNRRQLTLIGNQALQQAQRYRHPFSAMMIDIDHFKSINDNYGYAMGDEVLRKLADVLRQNVRAADISVRYGGEEFVILMPDTQLEAAYELAERLLDQIRGLGVDQGQFGVTASIGVAEMNRTSMETFESLLNKTDRALHTAKQAGRNQVFVSSEEPFLARLYRQEQEEIAARMKIEEELRRHREHLEELVQKRTAEVHQQATIDPLTGLFTRGHWIRLGNRALQEAQRDHTPFSVMMIDGDHFKDINDNFGHAMGDEAARKMANTLKQNARLDDIVGRYGGGDEFIFLMPNTNLQSASHLADRLLNKIRELQIDIGHGQILTVSIGVVEMDQNHPQTFDELVELADRVQYAAKRAGRNQVSVGNQEHVATD
jgi:diguanylate cyclase (GGDEF)-like protein